MLECNLGEHVWMAYAIFLTCSVDQTFPAYLIGFDFRRKALKAEPGK